MALPVYSSIRQQLALFILRIAHQIENTSAVIDMNFNSNPYNGNIASPPTIPKIAESDVVHAGHPGVNAVRAPPKTADVPPFFKFIVFYIQLGRPRIHSRPQLPRARLNPWTPKSKREPSSEELSGKIIHQLTCCNLEQPELT